MQRVAPKADPGLYIPMALGLTFPLNITLGMPLYLALVQAWRSVLREERARTLALSARRYPGLVCPLTKVRPQLAALFAPAPCKRAVAANGCSRSRRAWS